MMTMKPSDLDANSHNRICADCKHCRINTFHWSSPYSDIVSDDYECRNPKDYEQDEVSGKRFKSHSEATSTRRHSCKGDWWEPRTEEQGVLPTLEEYRKERIRLDRRYFWKKAQFWAQIIVSVAVVFGLIGVGLYLVVRAFS